MKDLLVQEFQGGDTVTRSETYWNSGHHINFYEVTRIENDKLYPANSKQHIRYQERLSIFKKAWFILNKE